MENKYFSIINILNMQKILKILISNIYLIKIDNFYFYFI